MELLLPPHISRFMQDNVWILLSVLMKIPQLSNSTFSHTAGSVDRSRGKTSKVSPVVTIQLRGPSKPIKRSISPHATSHGLERCHLSIMLDSITGSSCMLIRGVKCTLKILQSESMPKSFPLKTTICLIGPPSGVHPTQEWLPTRQNKFSWSSIDNEMWVRWC